MRKLTTETISTYLRNKTLPEFEFMNFPCHTQGVERCVKLVTEASDKLHKDIDSLKRAVDPKILPKEYGGVVPLAEMIADFKKYLETKREVVLGLDKMKIVINKKAKFVTELEEQQITGMAGSFRKLQVD
ncbi:hypothetical protein J6590_056226 [Homalodisca vitripennis]|nr:hypothetical protein J6590_056226 [Homalodisca vitripennis]